MEEKLEEAGVVKKPGSAVSHKTGSWRTFRPVVTDRCRGCSICTWFCPENGIKMEEKDGKKVAVIDYDHCKGCLICMEQCPSKAIDKKRE
jgi:pyruvate ferredoxin oxidoreductase delta subunit